MKKITALLFTVIACLALTGCGPNPEEYLKNNITEWNSSTSELSALQSQIEQTEELTDFAKLADGAAKSLEANEKRLGQQKALASDKKIPEDAEPLQTATIAYLTESSEMLKALQALSKAAADNGSEDDLRTKYQSLVDKFESMHKKASALSDEQDKYASTHKIKLNMIGQ